MTSSQNTSNGVTPVSSGARVLTAWGSRDTHKHSGKDYQGISWAEIVARASEPTATAKENAQFIIPSTYRGPDGRTHEVQRALGSFPVLCLDLDDGNPSIDGIKTALAAIAGRTEALIYSSSGAVPSKRKWRAIVPLSEPLSGSEYKATQAAFFALLAEQGLMADKALEREGQPVYLPNVPTEKRNADGKPVFYQFEHVVGPRLDLDRSAIVAKREEQRAEAEQIERERKARAEARTFERAQHIAARGDDFEPIEHFNSTHAIADLLARYGFDHGRGDDWRAPFQSSKSYALRDFGSHWVAVSSSYGDAGLGRPTQNGSQTGDAFDLFAFFEHNGDKSAAVRAYAEEVRPKAIEDTPEQTLRDIAALPPKIDAARARARLQTEVADGLRRDGVTLIEATLGLGKTNTAVEALPRLFAEATSNGIENPAVVLAFPTHALGRQVLDMIEAATDGLSVVQLYGPEAKDPENDGQTVCKQLDEYREIASLLLDTKELCGSCPFADECLHLKSKQARADIYVCSHERLKANGTPLAKDQTLIATIVDESPLSALVNASRRPVALAALMAAPATIRSKQTENDRMSKQADLEASRAKLQKTIEAHGLGYLRRSALDDWAGGMASNGATLEWLRKIDDVTHPDVMHNKTITAAVAVLTEIARSIDEGIEENARLKIQNGEYGLELVISGMKTINTAYLAAPLLMLDATAQSDLMAKLVGQPLAHHAKIEALENITIEQDPNISGAKSFFFSKGKPTGNVERVRHYVKAQAAQGGKTAVISNKDTIDALGLPDDILTGHFNALRGMNDMQDVDQLVIVGRTLPNAEAVRRLVGAIWGTPCEGDLNFTGEAWRRVIDGSSMKLAQSKTATHADPRAEIILRQIRDAEVMQAVGRLRGVNRSIPVRCIVLSDAVLNHPVKLVDLRAELQAHGVLGPMMDRGAVFLSPSQAARAYPDLYASKQAAAKVINRITDWATFSIEGLYGKGCPVVELKTARAKGTTLAIIAPWVTDPRAEIKRFLPNADVISDQAEAQAIPAPEPIQTPEVVNAEDIPELRPQIRQMRVNNMISIAPYMRSRRSGLPQGGSIALVAEALHRTKDRNTLAAFARISPSQVQADLDALFVLGLVDRDMNLEGVFAPRKLVMDCSIKGSDLMAAFITQRRVEVRAYA